MSNSINPKRPEDGAKPPSDLTIRRALLPEVLVPQDVRDALHLPSTRAAIALIRRGGAGPFVEQAGDLYVLRTTLLEHLQQRAGDGGAS